MENIRLQEGIVGTSQIMVKKEDTAMQYGSGLVEVFATPAMVAIMEKTCLESLLNHLPETASTVGTMINVSHSKATPMGMKVTCQSKLIEIDRRRLVFEVEAHDEEGLIGKGTHERFIIDKAKFMAKFK